MVSFRSIAKKMDKINSPTILCGCSIPWLQENKGLDWLKNSEALDLISSFPNSSEVGLFHKQNKGLFQMHRWPPSANASEMHSFKEIAKRHQLQPDWTFKFLWFNTWLLTGVVGIGDKPFIKKRCKEIAHSISMNNYHIVGLCEIFNESERETLRQILGQEHELAWARGPEHTWQQSSGLMTLGIDKVNIRSRQGQVFEEEGGGWDSLAEKGMLYTELELCPPGSNIRPAIDLFITHLHATESNTRYKQVKELVEFIRTHRKPNNPVIVAGDLNIDNRKPGGIFINPFTGEQIPYQGEYANLLEKMASIDLYDIWLSRGGFSGGTNVNDDEDDDPNYALVCCFDPNGENQSCEDYLTIESINPDYVPGKRLDYVFIESPKDTHGIIIDTPRVQRKPFWRGPTVKVDGESVHIGNEKFWTEVDGDKIPNFMSDHLGLEIDLMITPNSYG